MVWNNWLLPRHFTFLLVYIRRWLCHHPLKGLIGHVSGAWNKLHLLRHFTSESEFHKRRYRSRIKHYKDTHMKHPVLHLVLTTFLAAQVVPVIAQSQTAPQISGVKGKLEAATHDSISIQTPSGIVRVAIKQPLTTYRQ